MLFTLTNTEHILIEITVTHPIATGEQTDKPRGHAVERAETAKRSKYLRSLSIPEDNLAVLALETGGHFSSEAKDLLKRLVGSIKTPAAKKSFGKPRRQLDSLWH